MQCAVAGAQRNWIPRFSRQLAACLLLPIAFGCVTKGTYDEVVGERDRLAVARRDLEDGVEKLTAANQSLTAERVALIDENEDLRISTESNERKVASLTRVKSQLASSLETSEALLAIRSAEIENIRSSYDGLISDLESEVSSGQIQIEQLRTGLTLNLSDEILFPSGSAALNSSGQAVLTKVSRRLIELPHTIAVEGHTDDVPVARRYPSNWELAAARASSVVRLMIEQGVEPERLKVVSRAEFEPIASNETKEGRAKNRRIEIQLDAPIDDPDETSGSEEPQAEVGSDTPEADTSASPPTDAEGPPAP
jgi:chemotaxis protein MotB